MIRWAIATDPQKPRTRWVVPLLVVWAAIHAPDLTQASTAEERAMADALFREAKSLMRKDQHEAACRKLEESQRLDPRDGTLLNLAVCHEKEGKIATAWVEFQESLAAARRAKRWDRIQLAKRRLRALEDKIPNLTIEVAPGASVERFELIRNGVSIAEPVWGTAVPVDPGDHTIEATAPGMLPWETTVAVDVGENRTVVVPMLEEKPPPPSPSPPPPELKPEIEAEPEGTLSRRTTAHVVGGAGLAAVGVGAFFGLRAMGKSSESDDHCRDTLCDQRGLDLNDEANSAARVSNIAFGLGLVGVGVGGYLLWTGERDDDEGSPEQNGGETSPDAPSSRVELTPVAGRGQAAIFVQGTW